MILMKKDSPSRPSFLIRNNRMRPPERIKTERLVLRIPTLADAESIFNTYTQDPEVTRHLPWQPHEFVGQSRDFLAGCVEAWQGDTRFPYIITELGQDHAIGMIELRLDRFIADVGYALGRAYWSKGYMTEALQALIEWWKEEPSLYRLYAGCDVDNIGSARVMEKAGMQREGRLRRAILHPAASPKPRDCYMYSIVK
jgi:RimJ/RimL family protein N-acetyltransferase